MKSLALSLMMAVGALFLLPHSAFAADGKTLYASNKCVMCHNTDGTGRKTMKGTDLTTKEAVVKKDTELAKAITDGVKDTKMKAYTFNDEELKALVGYVRDLQKAVK